VARIARVINRNRFMNERSSVGVALQCRPAASGILRLTGPATGVDSSAKIGLGICATPPGGVIYLHPQGFSGPHGDAHGSDLLLHGNIRMKKGYTREAIKSSSERG
jgi:hypothetical protein